MSALKLWAFFKRDILEASSYKLNFIFSFFGIFFSSATFYFVSKLVSGNSSSPISVYGGDYFSFVIIGLAFSGVLHVFQEGLPGIIRNAQLTGTLEAILVTPTHMSSILFGSSLYSTIYSFAGAAFHILLALLVFGMELGNINWVGALSVFVLTTICFLSIGILSASFILIYKLGNPFSWIFGSLSGLFGGVFFPIQVLPDWLRWISYIIPLTYSLEGLRLSLLTSSSFDEILPSIMALFVFCLILLPMSLVIFSYALRRAKRDGTLTHY